MPIKKKISELEELRNIAHNKTQQALFEQEKMKEKEERMIFQSGKKKKDIRCHLIQVKVNENELLKVQRIAEKRHLDNYSALIRILIHEESHRI